MKICHTGTHSRIPSSPDVAALVISIRPEYRSRYSDSLRDGRSGDLIPVGGRLPATVQTSSGINPATCTMGTGSLPLEVKWPGCGVNHPPPSSAEIKKKTGAIPLIPLWAFMVSYRVTFIFTVIEHLMITYKLYQTIQKGR